MKRIAKFLFFALVLVSLIALAGCYKQSASEEETGDEQVSYIGEADVSEATDAVSEDGETDAAEEVPEKDATPAEIIGVSEIKDAEPAAEPAVTTTEVKAAAPAVSSSSDMKVFEGDPVQLKVKGTDPDGDAVTYTFSAPFDSNGNWQTKVGDAGDYLITVTASDGKTQSTKTIKISVVTRNNAPVIEKIADITVKEGETVTLSPKVLDQEGDPVTIKYSGWMSSNTKATSYNDAGSYTVTVTASDGSLETSQNVKVIVQDVNRAPEFEITVE
jgi:VCBS repeat-containing protein